MSFGAHEGSSSGMEKSLAFRMIVVPNHGAGSEIATMGDKDVRYDGSAMSVVTP